MPKTYTNGPMPYSATNGRFSLSKKATKHTGQKYIETPEYTYTS